MSLIRLLYSILLIFGCTSLIPSRAPLQIRPRTRGEMKKEEEEEWLIGSLDGSSTQLPPNKSHWQEDERHSSACRWWRQQWQWMAYVGVERTITEKQ